jgi:hypothetical protein
MIFVRSLVFYARFDDILDTLFSRRVRTATLRLWERSQGALVHLVYPFTAAWASAAWALPFKPRRGAFCTAQAPRADSTTAVGRVGATSWGDTVPSPST